MNPPPPPPPPPPPFLPPPLPPDGGNHPFPYSPSASAAEADAAAVAADAGPAAGGEPEVVARAKFSCPLCGGEARWDPAKQALVCAYCGSEAPATLNRATGTIEEHDLIAALRDIPDSERGWQTETRSVRCESCGAITVFTPERVAQRCDFCGATALVPYEQTRAPIRPESVLPFRIAEAQAREAIHRWYGSRWFAPDALRRGAWTDRVQGIYVPYWTFDAQARCPWTAEAGYHYYVTEEVTNSEGKTESKREQRTRWEPAAGHVDHFFDDTLIAASRGVPANLIKGIEPFPTVDQLVAYDPAYLSGWVVEQYQVDLPAAAARAEERMNAELRAMCSRQVPGDTQRNLQIYPEYHDQTYKHVLLPVWVISYLYAGVAYQLLVNGYTGKIAGQYPKSWIKITLFVLLLLALALAGYWVYHQLGGH